MATKKVKVTSTKVETNESPVKSIIGMEKEQKLVGYAIMENRPVLLIGETGVGKTHMIGELAKEAGKKLIRLSTTGEMGTQEILGKWIIKNKEMVWQDGVLIDAMKNGHWIVFDEINAALPEVLFALHSLLDDDRKITLAEKDGSEVFCHQDFRFFATMNPTDEYTGTKDMNKALMSRFEVVLEVGFPSQKMEHEILKYHIPEIDTTSASMLVDIWTGIRNQKRAGKIFHTASTRDLIAAGRMFVRGKFPLNYVLNSTVLAKAHKDDRKAILEAVKKSCDFSIDGTEEQQTFELLTKGMDKEVEKMKAAAEKEVEEWKAKAMKKATEDLDKQMKEYENKKTEMAKALEGIQGAMNILKGH